MADRKMDIWKKWMSNFRLGPKKREKNDLDHNAHKSIFLQKKCYDNFLKKCLKTLRF